MKYLYIVIFALCIISCSTIKNEYDEKLQVEYKRQFVNIDSFLDASELIQLKCPTTESVVRSIRKLLFINDKIVVADSKRLLLFDSEGNFIKSNGSMIGRGHNEYIQYMDVALDKYRNEIYLCAIAPKKIFVYDSDLNLKRVQDYNTRMMEIAVDKEYLYYVTLNDAQDVYGLECVKKDDIKGKVIKLASTDRVCVGLFTDGSSLTHNGGCYACLPFDNNLNELCDGKIVGTYVIDCGDKWYASSGGNVKMPVMEFIRSNGEKNWMYKNVYVVDSLLFCTTNDAELICVGLNSGNGAEYRGLYSKSYSFIDRYIVPCEGLDNTIVFSISGFDIAMRKEHLKDGTEHYDGICETALNILENYDDTDNPIILVWRLKADQQNKLKSIVMCFHC